MTEGQFEALFLLAGLVAGGGWAAFAARPGWAAAALVFAAACAWAAPGERRRAFADVHGLPPAPRSWALPSSVLLAAVLPAAFYLAATWGQEWPFSGDQPYHLGAHVTTIAVWTWLAPRILFAAALLWLCARRGWLRFGVPAAVALLWYWSAHVELPYTSVHYPGLGYLAALPVDVAARALWPDNPLAGPRLANVLWLAVWLLLLRPLLLRRWPDARLLPACLFFLWQKDIVWVFGSAYLEPLSLVLCLLAAERVLDDDPDKALDATLIAGAAALVKEQAAFLVPFVWLAARPWRAPAGRKLGTLRLLLAASAPFAFHYLLRTARGIWRVAEAAPASQVFAAGRPEVFAQRVRFELGVPGLIALAAAFAAALWTWRRTPRRAAVGWLLAGGAFQLAFFWFDKISLGYTGYARYNELVWLVLAAALVELAGLALAGDAAARRVAAAATAAAALNILVLVPFEARAATLPDPYLSYQIYYDDPQYFDIRYLERAARDQGALAQTTTLVLADRVGDYSESSWFAGYPRLRRRYRLGTQKTTPPGGPPDCRCRAPNEALLVPFRLAVNMNADRPSSADSEAFEQACLASLRETCARVVEDQRGGRLLGALGAGLNAAAAAAER